MNSPESADKERRRAPRPRRVPRTRAAQAKLDSAAELFTPALFAYDEAQAAQPMDERIARWFEERGWQPFAGEIFCEQPSGRIKFDVTAPFVFDIVRAPRQGTIDLCGLPW